METSAVIKELRIKRGLTQEQLAERVMVTRQAVSRWETGKTLPDTELLKALSREFEVSVNTLLGAPRQLFCQCCGMPLSEDGFISREKDGSFNEDYCKWCYSEGAFAYPTKESLIDFLTVHFPDPEGRPEEERRKMYDALLSELKHWKE